MRTDYVTAGWPANRRWQDGASAALAALICLTLLQQFNRQSGGNWKRLAIDTPVSVMALRLIPVKPATAALPERAPARTFAKTKVFTRSRSAKPAPPQPETSEASESSTPSAPAIITESAEPLSALRFDKEAIARAYKESKSEIQKMAEASGKDRIMEIGPPDKSERYQAKLAQGYKPDCISKSTGGAGLLAIPLIGYLVATDKCNFRK